MHKIRLSLAYWLLLIGWSLSLRAECVLTPPIQNPWAAIYHWTEALISPVCAQSHEALVDKFAEFDRSASWPKSMESYQIELMRDHLHLAQLRLALWQRDIPAARKLLLVVRGQLNRQARQRWRDVVNRILISRQMATVVGSMLLFRQPERWPDSDGLNVEPVLDGEWPALPRRINQPAAEWVFLPAPCGRPAGRFYRYASLIVGRADGLHALGQDQLAVQILLTDQWTDALRYAMVPPRLRQFAETAIGAHAYESAIADALASIETRQTAKGRRARMSLLGLLVPLPVGEFDPETGKTHYFESEAELADWLRPMFRESP